MPANLTPEQAKQKIARLERRLRAANADNREYRRVIREQSSKLARLQRKYRALMHNSDELLALQAADLLEMENYIQKLEARLNPPQQTQSEEQ